MRSVLAIGGVAVVRLVRDRGNLFFVFVFPLLLVLLIGMSFGGSQQRRLAVVTGDAGPATDSLVRSVEQAGSVVVDRLGDAAAAREAVARGTVDGALLVPAGYGDDLAAGTAQVELIGRADQQAGLRPVVEQATAAQATVHRAAAALGRVLPGSVDARALERLHAGVPETAVSTRAVGGQAGLAAEFAGLGQFDLGASSQLLLFVFVTSLSASSALVEDRELGMTARVLTTPTTPRQLIAGLGIGRYAVALAQGLYIIAATRLIFGVDWGDPVGAGLILAVFSGVSAGAAMLLGSHADNDAQASGLGVGLALGLAALGGSMAPLEVFPDTMRTIARATPHAWGNEAFAELVRRDGSVADIAPQLGVLAAMAVGLYALAAVRLRRRVSGTGG